ncbi:MAG: prepilin-type N-terminal cleavage/methylation domain-containing protein [Verrucomicrobiales bacterium]|nr:prepilin-type N-terminal cleavage/methylation domain-containing protein [Verrucomicrobiales bacterium]
MNRQPHSPHGTPRVRGFTLLELVAVLTILGLLAWIGAEGALARARRLARQAEATELALISEAWIQTMLRTQSIPTATNWTDWLASGSTLPSRRIARTASGTLRQLRLDPEARFGRPLTAPPFRQSATGSLLPASPRFILLSSVAEELPDLPSVEFDALWTNPSSTLPPGWPSSWPGSPEDLGVERIDLRSRFRRVVLQNLDTDQAAPVSIAGEPMSVPAGQTAEGWYLDGTLLTLKGVDGSNQGVEWIGNDSGFVFERRRWRRTPEEGPARPGGLGALADQFLLAAVPVHSGTAAMDRTSVVDDVTTLLVAYANWGAAGYPVSVPGDPYTNPLHRIVREAHGRLRDEAHHLLLP